MFFFRVESHPFADFSQCLTEDDPYKLGIYTTIVIIIQFIIPLVLMVISYAMILFKITVSLGQGKRKKIVTHLIKSNQLSSATCFSCHLPLMQILQILVFSSSLLLLFKTKDGFLILCNLYRHVPCYIK